MPTNPYYVPYPTRRTPNRYPYGYPGMTPPFNPNTQATTPIPNPNDIVIAERKPQQGAQPTPADQGNFMQRIWGAMKDPRFAAATMNMAGTMSQPLMPGQSPLGQATQAMIQGYNGVNMYNYLQQQARMQAAQQQLKDQETKAGIENKQADTGYKKAQTANVPLEQARKSKETDAQITNQKDRLEFDRTKMSLEQIQAADEIEAKMNRLQTELEAKQKEGDKDRNNRLEVAKIQHALDGERIKAMQLNAAANMSRANTAAKTENRQAKEAETGKPADNVKAAGIYERAYSDYLKQTTGDMGEVTPEMMQKAHQHAQAVTGQVTGAPKIAHKAQVEQWLRDAKAAGHNLTYDQAKEYFRSKGISVLGE